jgi:hypothetical protein
LDVVIVYRKTKRSARCDDETRRRLNAAKEKTGKSKEKKQQVGRDRNAGGISQVETRQRHDCEEE